MTTITHLSSKEMNQDIIQALEAIQSGVIVDGSHEYIVAFNDEEPVGFVKLYTQPEFDNVNIEYIAVQNKGEGISKLLLEKVFDIAHERGKTITTNGFTLEGQKHLAPILERMSQLRGQQINLGVGRC